jgi:acetylornithine/N-succinyldiaminopimelate aminotransferase
VNRMDRGHVMDVYKRWPIELVAGRGSRVEDSDGNIYIDMVAGIAVSVLGHAHPALTHAVSVQMDKLVHVSNLYWTRPQVELAQRLAALTGGMRSFFCNSGAESIECALKLARKWGRVTGGNSKTGVIATDGGFHGRTMGALTATGQPAKQAPFQPLVPGIVHVGYGDASAIEQAMNQQIAAVLLEPIQGEAGVIVPPDGYLADVREICDRAGALLMLDEVQTGLGRTGTWFAYEHSDIRPDVMCLAKGLAGGLPMGACLASPEVASAFQPGDHATTFGGGPVPSVAALAVIEVLEREGLIERASLLGEKLRAELEEIFGPGTVRGRGLMLGIDVSPHDARRFAESCMAHGLLVNDIGADTIRLVPPLVITDDDIEEALVVLAKVWGEL